MVAFCKKISNEATNLGFFSKTGIIDSFEGNQTGHGSQGHQGPITGVDTHSAFGQVIE